MHPIDLLESIAQAAELLSKVDDEKLEPLLERLEAVEDQIWFAAEAVGISRPYTEES